MNADTESRLEDMVETTNATKADVEAAFEEARETVVDRVVEDLSDEEIDQFALSLMKAEEIEQSRTTYGEQIELQVLAIGARSMQWSDGSGGKKDVVLAYGMIHPPGRRLPTDEGGEGPEVALAVFILDSTKGVDPAEAMRKFSALRSLTGTFAVSESSDISTVGDTALYRCEATTRTRLEEADEDEMDLPTDRDAKNAILRSRIPEATLAGAATDAAKVVSSFDPETGYAHEFGGDLRRVRASIVDYYTSDEGDWGRMTLLDDTVVEDDLPGTAVMPEADSRGAPGLTCWADPQYHINYGRKSQVDVYGYLETTDDGQIQMNAVGVVPILPMPLDEETSASSTSNATESSI